MNLENIREQIDEIDNQLIALFKQRMEAVTEVAKYKKENNLPVFSRKREREILNRISLLTGEDMAVYARTLYNTIFDISRSYETKKINDVSNTVKKIKHVIETTDKVLPSTATVACQGTEGAYSEEATGKLFANPSVMYFEKFKGVFEAVRQGVCRYGVLPIENSVHGSVSEVIDLMAEYDFNIVKSAKVQINHVLLAKSDTTEIKEIFSHRQAIGQCEKYLKSLEGVKITVVENTAVAAKMVAESDRRDVASISSPACADIYGLKIINSNIKDSDNNYTRFICISRDMEIYPGADKITVMLRLQHQPGSLYNLIAKFASVGVNLTKIESRPIAGLDFEFMFLLDMNVSVYSGEFMSLITELENSSSGFRFLGAYTEN